MPRFALTESRFGTFAVTRLTDGETGTELDITPHGAHVLAWRIPLRGRLFDIVDGYRSPEEFTAQRGARSRLMAPFSNRIADGRYSFGGQDYRLDIDNPRENVAIHGLVSKTQWRSLNASCGDDSAVLTLTTDTLRRDHFAGYPFDVDVTTSFRLDPLGLEISITGTNVGTRAAPFGCGWHPYFRTPSADLSRLRLTVPARTAIRTDARNIPLTGDDAYEPLNEAFGFHPPNGGTLGSLRLDRAYSGLHENEQGRIVTLLDDEAAGLRIALTQSRGLLHVFTGDTLSVRPRQALALEPVEFMTNAFNRPECTEAIRLDPGLRREFRFRVQVALGR